MTQIWLFDCAGVPPTPVGTARFALDNNTSLALFSSIDTVRGQRNQQRPRHTTQETSLLTENHLCVWIEDKTMTWLWLFHPPQGEPAWTSDPDWSLATSGSLSLMVPGSVWDWTQSQSGFGLGLSWWLRA